MKLLSSAIAMFMLFFAFAVPSMASASDESLDAAVNITPMSGTTFFNNAFKSANWNVESAVVLPGPYPTYPKITPLKVADLGLPPSSAFTFNPQNSMPVCPDDKVGPAPTNMSVPVPTIIARCPDSIIGNGTALFGLAQSTNSTATRHGEIVIFNGGLVGGLPKVKVYAYSYETNVGIYTSSILQPDGQLRFEIPRLTSDSSVRSLNLSIPSKKIVIPKPDFGLTVTLPAGQNPNYVQAKCAGNAGFPWTADFTLGSRDESNNPIGPPEFDVTDSGTDPCTGVAAKAKIGSVKISGPAKVKIRKTVKYTVKIKNSGTTTAKSVRLKVSGRGVSFNTSVGSIGAGKTAKKTVKLKFKKKGKAKVTFKVSSGNAGGKTAKKTVKVVK